MTRVGRIERAKRRMIQEAVADNLDTIRGGPPRVLRPARRAGRLWLRRSALLLVPLTLAGSSYLVTNTSQSNAAPVLASPRVRASILALPAAEGTTTPNVERVTAAAFPLAVRRIVLDAGHGGVDPGAIAPELIEKNITLDIGRRLRMLLEARGFEVLVTRGDDRTVALRERAKLANESKSDIFVSIHVNAITKHTESRGVETYYLGPTNDQRLTELAAAENRVSGYSMADMRRLLDGVYADARRDESQQLATLVQKELHGTLRRSDAGLENWGVKRAPFIVLVATDMPAILAEVGCLSNEHDAAMLRSEEYRQKIADALSNGIESYARANTGP